MANLSGFLVVPAVPPNGNGHVIQLVCVQCREGGTLVAESAAGYNAGYEGPAVSDLVAAATRHTWENHPHPQQPPAQVPDVTGR